jgi:thioredoxin reductase
MLIRPLNFEGSVSSVFDVIILGGGCAGYTAAIYAGRAMLNTLLLEGPTPGGQLTLTSLVENYPGFPEGILGPPLMERMRRQAERFGAKLVPESADRVDFTQSPFRVWAAGVEYRANAVIIATGASPRRLGVPGEDRLMGRGVSTCATCLPPGSPVVAYPSITPIDTIDKGQLVLTVDGTYRPVAATLRRWYVGELVRIRTSFFGEYEVVLTPNHPVLACRWRPGLGAGSNWDEPRWLPAGSIAEGDLLLYPIPRESVDTGLLPADPSSPPQGRADSWEAPPAPIPLDGRFMRLAGYYLGGGVMTSRGVEFHFGAGDRGAVRDAASSLKDLFGLRAAVYEDGGVMRLMAPSEPLRALFTHLFGGHPRDKRLPGLFMRLPPWRQRELVRGLWRAGGSMAGDGFRLVTVSPQLAEQLKIILLRLGIIPHVSRRPLGKLASGVPGPRPPDMPPGGEWFQLRLDGALLARGGELLGLRHPPISREGRGDAQPWLRGGFALLPVTGVSREPYRGYVYNLSVEGNHTYATPNGVLHNCDGPFFKGREVAVVGGGDSAMEEALYLAHLGCTVNVIHRRDRLRASRIMQARAFNEPRIRFLWNTVVEEVLGSQAVEGVVVRDLLRGERRTLGVSALFVAIGHEPNTSIFRGQVEVDERGYIVTRGDTTHTSREGVFAAGEVRDWRYRQAVTAAGDGCKAAIDAERYLREKGLI